MGSPSEQVPESFAREVAGEVGSAVKLAAEPMVEDAVSSVAMLVLLVLLVPVGIVGLVVSFLLLALITTTIGFPTGALGSIFGITWFAGTLVALALLFRKLYRRMPRRLRAAYAAPMQQDIAKPVTPGHSGQAFVAAPAPKPTLAGLDAGLAPEPGPPTSG